MSSNGVSAILRGIALTFLISFAVPGANASDLDGWDRFSFLVSAYRPGVDTQVRFDAANQVQGTELDLEGDLQLDDTEIVTQYYASLRLTRRISLEGSYQQFGRSAETTLAGNIEFGDTTFPVSLDVSSEFSADIATAAVRWAFIHNDTLEFGASIGVYWMSLEAGISEVGGSGSNEVGKADSPLPMAGLAFGWNLTRNLQLRVQGDYLPIRYDEIDGTIANYRADLQYRFLRYFGLGVGYEVFDVDIESKNSGFSGDVRFRQTGPKAFVTMRF